MLSSLFLTSSRIALNLSAFGSVLLLTLTTSSCAHLSPPVTVDPSGVVDTEPNDTLQSATEVQLYSGLVQIENKLSRGDFDVFSFHTPNRGTLVVSITNIGTSGEVGEVTLQDSLQVHRGTLGTTASGERQSSRPIAVSRGQRYFVQISSQGELEAAYRLDLRFRDQ